ncbi:MAG: hypothetical protein V3S30_07490 [Thermoanaerobaculia bacterium]
MSHAKYRTRRRDVTAQHTTSPTSLFLEPERRQEEVHGHMHVAVFAEPF